MENERYMREGLDLKRLFLRFANKIWLAAAAVVTGAALGALLYLAWHLVFAPEREYQSVSKVYLNFNCEPEDFNELSYNGYTWNDLMVTDPILNYTMEALPSDVSRETVTASTKAEILSDIRLLTVTITASRPDWTAQIMAATQEALVHLGETDELFHSIEIYSTTEPAQIIWDNRTVNAAMTGAVLAFFLILVFLGFRYALDDSVYVEADAEKKYALPVFGIFTEGEAGTFQSYAGEFLSNYNYLCKDLNSISLVSVDCAGDAQKAEQTMSRILSTEKGGPGCENLPMSMPEDAPDVYEAIRNTEGTLLIVRYGRGNGKRTERTIRNLRQQDCRLLGILIVEADLGFLKKYYSCGQGKKNRHRR